MIFIFFGGGDLKTANAKKETYQTIWHILETWKAKYL